MQGAEGAETFDASTGLLFWRAMTQWLGGMGVVVLIITILPSVGGWGFGFVAGRSSRPSR